MRLLINTCPDPIRAPPSARRRTEHAESHLHLLVKLPFMTAKRRIPTFPLTVVAALLFTGICASGMGTSSSATAQTFPAAAVPPMERPPDLGLPAEPPQPEEEMVAEVRIRGNKAVPVEKILPHVHTRKGRPFSAEKLEEDVRRLYKTRMFVTIKTSYRRDPAGRVVIFEVVERPTMQYVKYIGNQKIKRKVLEREAGIKPGDAMDPSAIEEARRMMEDFYKTRGFPNIRISIAEGTKPDDRGAVFVINEGRRQKVLWTSFVGNTIASDARLRTQIESKPGILWVFDGDVDMREIDEDVNRLTAYYRGLGFFRARIGRELEYSKDGEWAHVTFIIDEGPRYVVRNVSIIGNEKLQSDELTEDLKLTAGQYFNQDTLSGDIATLQEEYGSVGYIFADVQADPRFLEEPGKLDLVYNISEGHRYRVGRINVDIDGENPHTQITTVLNRISLQPGDIVDIREIRDSERRIRSSRLFEVDPASGAVPKIVFSRPGENSLNEEEETPQVARRPKRAVAPGDDFGDPTMRFQSPGPPRPVDAGSGRGRLFDWNRFGRLIEDTDGGAQ